MSIKQKHFTIASKKTLSVITALFLIFVATIIFILITKKENKNNNQIIENSTKKVLKIESPKLYQHPLVISVLDNFLSITPVNANNVTQEQLDPNTIKYRDAYPSTDVEQIKYPNKLKESLILKGPEHPKKFEYQIDIENFNWELNGDGDIIISSKKEVVSAIASSDGSELSAERMKQYSKERGKIFKIPKPFMFEQGKDERGEVKTEIIADRLVLTPDPEWLTKHRYPVIVDPTVEKMPQMIEELAEKRSYNSLTFLNDDGSYTTMAHIGHINYKDTAGQFKLVDTTLKETPTGWIQDKASYKSHFPKYADDWMEFENMYEQGGTLFRMKPVASHIAGQLISNVSDEWHGKKVVYKDAFGEGNDLELMAGNIAMYKYIKLNQKPVNLERNYEIYFELNLQQNENLIINGQIWNGQHEITTTEQIGIESPSGSTSYLRKFTAWDKNGITVPIEVKIFQKDGKYFFVKVIPNDFLAKAEYPVYTDASGSYYTPSADGHVGYTNSSWATCRSASDGDSVSNTRTDRQWARSDFYDGTTYEITRLFLPVNTAGLDDSAVISAASLNLYGGYIRTLDDDSYDYSVIVQTSQASATALATTDYDQVGSTAGSSTYDTSALTEGGWNSLALNATGLGWISKTGYTLLGIREGHDMANHAAEGRTTHEYAVSETTGYEPYLSVTYTVVGTITSVTDTPDPTNPGRSVSFILDYDSSLAIKAKICKTNSLTNQNCDGGYWASSTDFTTMDPMTIKYDVVIGDAGQTRNYTAFICDTDGSCSTGTGSTFSVNASSTVPNIKVRGGLKVR